MTATEDPTVVAGKILAQMALRWMAAYQDSSGKALSLLMSNASAGRDILGWFSVPCPADICGTKGGFLVAYRYNNSLGAQTYVWYVDKNIDKMYFVNGLAKAFTKTLPGALASGSIKDIPATVNLMESLSRSTGIKKP